MNELSQETSPYLLQHARNPVHWKAWNPKSLSEAKKNNRLIVISIGYSACHWCHVMEHETFEDDEASLTMNAGFINIKVDREERPDVDAVYMKAVQIMTGRGGWPLNIVALPDGRPVWGGTYFRKDEWINTLEQLQELYKSEPEKMIDYAIKLHQAMEAISKPVPSAPAVKKLRDFVFDSKIPENLVAKWAKSFDLEFGGMARAPKFMMPNNYQFLLRYAHQTKNDELLDFVNLTLTRMAWGGLFDTLGGGFSRYSVDMKWHVPHFEKMLYDNGQLVSLYADAYKLTKDPLYKEVIAKTLDFISAELLSPEGGFFSALDADSLDEKMHLEEGAFYTWTKEDLQKLLKEDFSLFSEVFNINDLGYWENGNFVLIQSQPLETIAEKYKIAVTSLRLKKQLWERLLYEQRQKRSKPRLDDKCLGSWNAIMLKGFVDAYKALQNKHYLEIALRNADFIVNNMWSEEGHLFRNYKNGQRTINAYLEDYSFTIQGFIALYEATFDEKWLAYARQLADYCFEHFYDTGSGFFAFTSNSDEALISRHFETEDNVIPASNSVMAENLFRLSIYFGNLFYEDTTVKMLHGIIPVIDYPSAFSNWLNVYLNFSPQNRELAITGKNALQHANEINQRYFPQLVIAGSEKPSGLPFLENRFIARKSLFYVCQDKSCSLPVEKIQEAITQLKS